MAGGQDKGSGELGQQELGSVRHGRGKADRGLVRMSVCLCVWVGVCVYRVLLMEVVCLLVLKLYETCSRDAMSTNPLRASGLGLFLPVGPREFTPGFGCVPKDAGRLLEVLVINTQEGEKCWGLLVDGCREAVPGCTCHCVTCAQGRVPAGWLPVEHCCEIQQGS